MNAYLDANALVRHYLDVEKRQQLMASLMNPASPGDWPVPVTEMLRFEVTNAIERMVFETRNGGTARITPELALIAQGDFELDLNAKILLRRVPLTLTDIEREFDSLARRYTGRHGFRTYDLIHVASAVKLRCQRFISFDTKANARAKLVGLKTL